MVQWLEGEIIGNCLHLQELFEKEIIKHNKNKNTKDNSTKTESNKIQMKRKSNKEATKLCNVTDMGAQFWTTLILKIPISYTIRQMNEMMKTTKISKWIGKKLNDLSIKISINWKLFILRQINMKAISLFQVIHAIKIN